MMKITKDIFRGDISEFPKDKYVYGVDWLISTKDMNRLFMGFEPINMEDKWIVYKEKNNIYFHSSWTGYCIYVLSISESKIHMVSINGLTSQYPSAGKIKDLNLLLDVLKYGFNIDVIRGK